MIRIGPGDGGAPVPAVAYVAGGDKSHGYTVEIGSPPSEQYCVAIHGMLCEHWPKEASRIEIRSYHRDGSRPSLHSTWLHPGTASLSLEALVVEVSNDSIDTEGVHINYL